MRYRVLIEFAYFGTTSCYVTFKSILQHWQLVYGKSFARSNFLRMFMDFFRICLAENPSYDIGPHFWKMQSTDGVLRSDDTKFSEML